MIKFPTTAVRICTLARCRMVLMAAFVVPLFLTIPSYFSFEIQTETYGLDRKTGHCLTKHFVEISEFDGSDVLFSANMWLYGIILKLLPCLVLIVFTCGLIHAMYQAESKSARLKQGVTNHDSKMNSSDKERGQHVGASNNRRHTATDRTTNLLVIILILFLISELPLGILGMLSAILGKQFFMSCYFPVGEMMDMLALTNSGLNFILYCLMSSQFRKTLSTIFCWNKLTSLLHSKKQNKLGDQFQEIPMLDHQIPKSEQISIKSGGVNNGINNTNSNGNMNSISPISHHSNVGIIATNGNLNLTCKENTNSVSPTTASIVKSNGRIQTTVEPGDKLL